MATLVRPWIVEYRTRDGKRVKKGTPGAKKHRYRSSKWYGQGVPGHPPRRRIPLSTHKRVAEQMLAELVEQGERGIVGLPARGQASRPLAPLVEEFREAVGRKAAPKQVRIVVGHVNQVLDGCRLRTLADLQAPDLAPRVERFVWALMDGDDGLTGATAACFGKHARYFTRWLWRKRQLLAHDPLAGMDLPSQESTAKRRALSAEELARLIEAAQDSPRTFRRVAGPDRAVLYLVAAATGYRCSELARLTPAHFDLDADLPVVRLSGRQTKNKKAAEQPLPPAVVARLRAYLAGRPADRRVWPGSWPESGGEMFRADLEAAGLPVVVGDEEATLHSLRHTYTTLLGQYAPVKVTQELARHSTPVLTIGRYSHTGMKEKAEAVCRLPLPGADAQAGPFAGMSRAELEAAAEGLLAALLAIMLAPPLAPDLETAGDRPGPTGTRKGRKRAA